MRELRFDIIFWDSINPKTIEHISIEEAYRENYIEVKNNTIIPTDECAIIRQYTGLKDKNGIDIYEGDIIKTLSNDWGVIVWKAPFFETTVSEDQSSLYTREWYYKSEVIGNIHQNPELINQ